MAKELTPAQKKIRRQARKIAEGAGKDWRGLPKEDRQNFIAEARRAPSRRVGNKKTANPARERAKQAAQAAGLSWQTLSIDQRKAYIRDAKNKGE
jgi:hypothetical protein